MFGSWIRVSLVLMLMVALVFSVDCQKTRIKPADISKTTVVILQTNMGDIELELFPDKAPISVENFLSYVRSGFYDNTIFHRVIEGFMIQGGGFDQDLNRKETNPPIINEATNGLKNSRGTIAYARTNVINSATSQFFINLVNNHRLNYRDNSEAGFGYAVFGKVIKGMNVVDRIGSVRTGEQRGMQNVPVKPVIILSARIVEEEKKEEE